MGGRVRILDRRKTRFEDGASAAVNANDSRQAREPSGGTFNGPEIMFLPFREDTHILR